MNRFRLISFLLLFSLGTAITVFNSCNKDDAPIDKNDQPGTDPDKPDSYAVTGISLLGDNTLSLAVDSSYTFKTTVWPEYATDQVVTWTSSDPAKVEVSDNGKITALTVGTALITAKVGDKTDTCRVTAIRKATRITLNYSSLTLIIGVEDSLEVTVEPADATDIITWVSTEPGKTEASKYITVSGEGKIGKLTAVNAGKAYVKVKVGDKLSELTCIVTAKYDETHDRGVIIDNIKWATRNVNKPGEFVVPTPGESAFAIPREKGMFYQWNHDIGWSTDDPMVSSDGSS